MARITVGTGRRTFLSRIVFLIAGLALIVICAKGLALQFLGTTTSATITKVSFQEDVNSDRDYYTTNAYVSYTFEVNGTEYTGSATFSVSSDDGYAKTGAKYLTGYDLKFREEWQDRKALQVKYLPMYPKMSDAAENTKNSVTGLLLSVVGMAFAFSLILLAFKPNKKQKAAAYQPPQQNIPYARPVAPPGYDYTPNTQRTIPQQPVQAPAQTQQAVTPKFCPNCGAKVSGGAFCEECGNKLN